MSFTTELMDAAKSAQGIASDYRLAQVLGVTRATVSTWRRGVNFPGYTATCDLARMAGQDAGAALLAVGMDRRGGPQDVAARRVIGRQLAALAGPDG